MNSPGLPAKQAGMNISPDNPFRDRIIQWQNTIKTATRTTPLEGGGYKRTRIAVIEQSEYYPAKHSKVYHQMLKSVLNDLTPSAAWIFLYIIVNMDFEREQVLIDQKELSLSRPTTQKALVELMSYNIIRKVQDKKQWYWVDITMVIVGNISKQDQWDDSDVSPDRTQTP